MQNWYRPHPYGVYPRGNAPNANELTERFGTLSKLYFARTNDDKEQTEGPFIDLIQYLLSFLSVPELCRLSTVCTGWYVMIHCTDAWKQAYQALSPSYLRFWLSWKDSAIQAYLQSTLADGAPAEKRRRREKTATPPAHAPVCVGRAYFGDQLFQAWMCTILPPYYHLRKVMPTAAAVSSSAAPSADSSRLTSAAYPARASPVHEEEPPQYASTLKPVARVSGTSLSIEDFRERFEEPGIPVILTGIATEWPLFHCLQGRFDNLAKRKADLVRSNATTEDPLRCEFTRMSLEDYVHYATEQNDERPIYMFDAEFGSVLDAERLYTVPPHFAADDFFSTLGAARPKFRWIIAGPARGGSSFHVDPNYTHAWNANLTGRKRWLFFPPGHAPPGVVPSHDMAEVATPVSLTEWMLNYYDASVEQLGSVGYECIAEAGEIVFVPSGWWHYVINLEDSVAITQNYVSRSNLPHVLKFLRAMKGSISGIDEDADDATADGTERRQKGFAAEFTRAMTAAHPDLMKRMEDRLEAEHQAREARRIGRLTMLDASAAESGFQFAF